MHTSTLASIREIFQENLGISPESITPEARLEDDLGVDSMDRLGLVFALESEFGLDIPDQDAESFRTIQDIVSYIQENQ